MKVPAKIEHSTWNQIILPLVATFALTGPLLYKLYFVVNKFPKLRYFLHYSKVVLEQLGIYYAAMHGLMVLATTDSIQDRTRINPFIESFVTFRFFWMATHVIFLISSYTYLRFGRHTLLLPLFYRWPLATGRFSKCVTLPSGSAMKHTALILLPLWQTQQTDNVQLEEQERSILVAIHAYSILSSIWDGHYGIVGTLVGIVSGYGLAAMTVSIVKECLIFLAPSKDSNRNLVAFRLLVLGWLAQLGLRRLDWNPWVTSINKIWIDKYWPR